MVYVCFVRLVGKVALLLVACGARTPLDGTPVGDGASTPDAPCSVALSDPTAWSSHDVAPIDVAFVGGAFDGTYVYFIGGGGIPATSPVVRYDTRHPFDDPSSWQTFDLLKFDANAADLGYAAFDGRYLYVVVQSTSNSPLRLERFDTRGDFTDAASWTSFQTSLVLATSVPSAVVFDGRYLNFSSEDGSRFARYDTQSNLTGWEAFDASTLGLNKSSASFSGTFDGRFVYFATATSGIVVQFDTTKAFTDATAWKLLHSPSADEDQGSAFDGSGVYLVPNRVGTNVNFAGGDVTRYDLATMTWSSFDVSTIDPRAVGFSGAAFDGQCVYLVPTETNHIAVRHDSTKPFDTPAGWSSFDITSVTKSPTINYDSAVFDGQYVYFVPFSGSPMLRFRTRAQPALPPLWNASFF